MTAPAVTAYERALSAEPELRAAVAVVDALTALVRPTDRLCASCVWDAVLKPVVSPLIGWERGCVPETAPDPRPEGAAPVFLTRAELMADRPDRVPATTETEAWLRSTEAWDGFTGPLIARLEAADPGNGHGVGQEARS
ncbi:hypothetical protein [Streptomyces parvulus]|uniref:hypothetical protein n=1 Tax=Streptomyces parvulus TaxID=146923 RepID=UPI00210E508C|nr:hypothetical protein [Streptomyces parvulus]MCQ4193865.1 hypothetical protein [Streptomyces parvulus]